MTALDAVGQQVKVGDMVAHFRHGSGTVIRTGRVEAITPTGQFKVKGHTCPAIRTVKIFEQEGTVWTSTSPF